eukprot:CAMPEP_0205907522 /NCGR_PEP_ID=MMETSP1325-20131115/2610_1 /ASSEMBLY_ACC=CAM_ASM_000708 /TAXON_ID=236786 /ORGANISM="Florenciella sp., Strain RCC1007" /LENGTH=260 /DNA_ID=CAMNT_0053273623 /DNA_START=137 /DNA_END=919 /DNA_ORIENTATION=+
MDALIIPELQELSHKLAEPALNFGIPAAYLACTLGGYAIMRPLKGLTIPDWFKLVYNVFQVSLSMYCVILGMPVVTDFIAKPFGIGLPIDGSGPEGKYLHYCICIHFLSKFVDYVDTLLIVLRKADKQLSVLHVYHHCTISMVWGYLINIQMANGTICFGAWINAVIHSIMYSYYAFTVLKLGIAKLIKVWVTRVQLIQFCSCICHAVSVMILEKQISFELASLQFGYHCTMIALFGQFYISNYSRKSKEKKASKDKKSK